MKIIDTTITLSELKEMAQSTFGDMVKAVVDIEEQIMAVHAEMHADQEKFLLTQGSDQKNLWGINLYPFNDKEDWIEFDSLINIRPWANNRTRSVDDPAIREKIINIVHTRVQL